MSLRPTTPPAFISFPKPLIVATFYFQWLVCILQISTWRQVFLYVYMSSTIVQFSCAQLFQTNKQLVWLFIFLNFICQQKNRHFLLLETHFKLKTQSPSRVRSLFLPLSVWFLLCPVSASWLFSTWHWISLSSQGTSLSSSVHCLVCSTFFIVGHWVADSSAIYAHTPAHTFFPKVTLKEGCSSPCSITNSVTPSLWMATAELGEHFKKERNALSLS